MVSYQPTEEERAILSEINDFRKLVKSWSNGRRPEQREEVRSAVNRQVERIEEIVRLAGCLRTLTISPPPMIGGLIMRGVNPFNYIFQDVYGDLLHDQLFDMLDKTIGVIEAGKFNERRSRLKKTTGPMGPISGKKVFLVHGHDDSARESVARFLEKLGLEPIILHEQPNEGQTIIEKVERHAEVVYAVVLLTPDDVGAVATDREHLQPRARQNVILELGYFLGKLGRNRVAALRKGEIEKPSDYDGVIYIPLDPVGAWKLFLGRELKNAGLNVDLNDAM